MIEMDFLKRFTWLAVLVISLPLPVKSQNLVAKLKSLQPIEIAYPEHGLEVGTGWDALLGRKTGST